MIHECNRALENIWSAAALGHDLELRPADGLTDHAFLCRRWDHDHYVFSHVGAAVRAIHGRELIDHNLLELWRADDRAQVRDALEHAINLRAPVLLRSSGRRITGGSIAFEATFWPLAGPASQVDRVLGAIAPCVGAHCVGAHWGAPVIEHGVDEIGFLPGATDAQAPRAARLVELLMDAGLRPSSLS
ncbi:MAG: PAS domain-containing protein [Maricaulaceae bacterium]|jgi:hypothetical protein